MEKDDGVDYDDDIGNPVFESSQNEQTSSFPDLKSGVFQQLLENMPYVLIKTANSDEELDTFFRMEFPLIKIEKAVKLAVVYSLKDKVAIKYVPRFENVNVQIKIA